MTLDVYLGLGTPTSRVGLGCGRLAGRASLRGSAEIVECALELGIRHFDVAPSYGLGTAEEVLGAVLGSVPGVTITTKVGIPRSRYRPGRAFARRVLKPIVGRSGRLGRHATRVQSRSTGGSRARFTFTRDAIRASLEESLAKLRRESVDLLLLHEPHPGDLSDATARALAELADERTIGGYGVGIDAVSAPWQRFGSLWQSRWPGREALARYSNGTGYAFHGVLRYATLSSEESFDASENLRMALCRAPDALILVSASSPKRLRDLLEL